MSWIKPHWLGVITGMAKKGKEFDRSKYSRWIDPNTVTPYEKNAKIHTDKQIKNIVNSIKRFGWQQDVVITSDNVLVIGHGRRLAAIKLGCEMPYHVIDKTADKLTEEDIRELRIADNQTNAETGFDFDALADDIDGLDFVGFDFDFGLPSQDDDTGNQYTTKASIPQYEPTGEGVELNDLVDTQKTDLLIDEISHADVSEEEKRFLIHAAQRHIVFNYKKIAEYYAQTGEEMQRLMERSALVIIDIDNAIAEGYAKLAGSIGEMRDES
jgi:glycerophosphoryl diester phosphodiesterase